MKDAIGQPLTIGDVVTFIPPYSAHLGIGTIVKFTTKSVRVSPLQNAPGVDNTGIVRDPAATVKITQQYKYFGAEYPELLL